MYGMPSAPRDLLHAAGDVEHEALALDDARAGDQEERPVRPDLEAAELHWPAAAGIWPRRCSRAARMKPVNSGCPSRGVERNSGWYWLATKNGWCGSSMISTRPSREKPEKRRPAFMSRCR